LNFIIGWAGILLPCVNKTGNNRTYIIENKLQCINLSY
jgi:hypothetical protein